MARQNEQILHIICVVFPTTATGKIASRHENNKTITCLGRRDTLEFSVIYKSFPIICKFAIHGKFPIPLELL